VIPIKLPQFWDGVLLKRGNGYEKHWLKELPQLV